VSWWDIYYAGGCPKCAGKRLRPTNLSLWEKIVQIIKHPRVWAWPKTDAPPSGTDKGLK
jgi:hypothetical protein